MDYTYPLSVRIRRAELKREAYRKNPQLRLRKINQRRARQGTKQLTSIDEAQLRIPLGEPDASLVSSH